jgi:RNA polymerase sigma-70 factor, ECF subfamily
MSSDANQLRALNGFHLKERSSSPVTRVQAPIARADAATDDLIRLPDEALIDLLKAGSREPIAILFARYRQLIYAISMKILRDAAEAEDVLQDIFLEVWEKAARFDSARGTVKVWLIQFAYSRSLNRRRDIALRRGTNGAAPYREIEASYVPDTVEKLTVKKQLDNITEAFQSLSQRQKEALRLIYFEGLSIKEVADRMRETVENVRHHYYRGLKRLREVLVGIRALDRK